jgi:hypothetical protein
MCVEVALIMQFFLNLWLGLGLQMCTPDIFYKCWTRKTIHGTTIGNTRWHIDFPYHYVHYAFLYSSGFMGHYIYFGNIEVSLSLFVIFWNLLDILSMWGLLWGSTRIPYLVASCVFSWCISFSAMTHCQCIFSLIHV